MKDLFSTTAMLAAAGLAILLTAVPASAQTTVLTFDSPVPFAAGDRVLPAGQYRLTVERSHMLFVIDSTSGSAFSTVRFIPDGGTGLEETAGTAKVRLTKYGARYFLTGVWNPGWLGWKSVVPSHRLVEAARVEGTREIAASVLR